MHASVKHQAALGSAEAVFYPPTQIIPCRRHKACDSLPIIWKWDGQGVGSRCRSEEWKEAVRYQGCDDGAVPLA